MSDNCENGGEEQLQKSQIVEIEQLKQQHRQMSPLEENNNVSNELARNSETDDGIEWARQYKPKSSSFNYDALCKLPNFVIKPFKDRIYFGQYFNRMKQGRGVLLYTNQRVYEGHWENDRKHGYGYEGFGSGAVYVGYYANNKPHGVGKYVWANGELYEGEWVNGTKHGNGMWIGIKGDKYVGEWQQGKPHGQGVHTWINGDRYEGEFSECLKQGHGKEVFGNGDTYEGYYSNGKPDGMGKYTWIDGAYFKGQFQNGLRCGRGEYSGPRYKYNGHYMNDRKNGMGEFIYPDGKVYRGNFFDDQKDGFGVLEMPDGQLIKQNWVMGQLIEDSNEPMSTTQTSAAKPPQYSIMRYSRLGKNPNSLRDNNQTAASFSERNVMLQTQQSQTASFQESPGQSNQNSRVIPFAKPPVPKKSSQSYRTTRITSEYKTPQASEDFFLQTATSISTNQRQNMPPIPIIQRPVLRPRSKSREVTPETKSKLTIKPDFSLRFDPNEKTHFKTSTGLKGIKKTLIKTATLQSNSKSKLTTDPNPNKVAIRIRSISSSISGNIRQMTQGQH